MWPYSCCQSETLIQFAGRADIHIAGRYSNGPRPFSPCLKYNLRRETFSFTMVQTRPLSVAVVSLERPLYQDSSSAFTSSSSLQPVSNFTMKRLTTTSLRMIMELSNRGVISSPPSVVPIFLHTTKVFY